MAWIYQPLPLAGGSVFIPKPPTDSGKNVFAEKTNELIEIIADEEQRRRRNAVIGVEAAVPKPGTPGGGGGKGKGGRGHQNERQTQELLQKQLDEIEEIVASEPRRRVPYLPEQTTLNWMWRRRRWEEADEPPLDLQRWSKEVVSPEILVGPADQIFTAQLVTWDPRATVRSRRHQQQVSEIMNSLILREELILSDEQVWALGYAAALDQSWAASNAPETVTAALDRLAALLKVLNAGVGP